MEFVFPIASFVFDMYGFVRRTVRVVVCLRRSRALPAFVLSSMCGVFAASLAGCGGGSTSGAPLPNARPTATATAGVTQNAGSARVEFVIQWPSKATSSKRTRSYLSPSTQSITIAGTGFPTLEVDNPNIASSASPSPSTTQTVDAPVGTDTFTVTDYDALKGAGHVLAANGVQFTVVIDQANVVPITLNGNLASIVCAPVAPNVFDTVAGTNGAYTQNAATGQIILMPEDAGGNIIVAPGTIPALTLAATTPSQATVTPFSGTANEFNVGLTTVGLVVALTASGTDLSGAAVTNTSCSDTLAGPLYHPGDNGDAFSMSGKLLVTYSRPNQYPTPEPTSTSSYDVTQSIAVTNPATFNGTSGAEFAITETDAQTAPAAQNFSDTLDQYYQYSNNMYTGNFLNLGYTETDDTGYTTSVTNGANDMLADILPEASGATWSNTAAKTITTNDGSGDLSSTTYADDGSYTGTITYQNYMPSPNPTGTPQLTNQATLTANVDGSADYKTPRLGTALQYNYEYRLQAPTAAGSGTITETTTIPPAVGSTSTPEAVSTTIANWMPASVPGSLYKETDVDNGPIALPAACTVPAALTGTPNQIVQTKTAVDPLNGELDVTTTTTYDTANVGPICVVLSDVQTDYYDFSGQAGTGYFSATPQQITTVAETLSLSAETVQSIARRHDAQARADLMRAVNVALAQGRIAILRTEQRLHRLAPHSTSSYRSFRGMLK